MNLEQKVKEYLFEHGIWEDECQQIFEELKKTSEKSCIKWSDSADGYPDVFWKAVAYSAKLEAIKWLKENKPQHFALFMLESE